MVFDSLIRSISSPIIYPNVVCIAGTTRFILNILGNRSDSNLGEYLALDNSDADKHGMPARPNIFFGGFSSENIVCPYLW